MACLGDVMLAGSALDALRRLGTESMIRRLWGPVTEDDIVLANLEAPVTAVPDVRQNKRYSFQCPCGVLDLFDRRFILSLANNHILDYGERGLLDTIEDLDRRNLLHAGAGRNLEEAGRPAILNFCGVRLGVICAADPRFQAATQTSAGTFPAVPEILRESIRELRKRVDIAVASIHGGQEYLPVPSQRQRNLAELCLEEGANVVSFHHAHCISGVHRDRRGVVFYGTGNFVFPWGDTPRGYLPWRESAVWRVIFNRDSRKVERMVIVPVILDEEGLPGAVEGKPARRILGQVARYSERINNWDRLRWWRLREMMNPVYVWMNLTNYADIARRQGIRVCLRTLADGITAQLTSRRSDRRSV